MNNTATQRSKRPQVQELSKSQALEDRIDLAAARAALAEAKVKGTKSLQTLKKELGL